jgi:hypothetical protein
VRVPHDNVDVDVDVDVDDEIKELLGRALDISLGRDSVTVRWG